LQEKSAEWSVATLLKTVQAESNSVRVVDSVVDRLNLADLCFEGVEPAATGRPDYRPSVILKLYIYGISTGCGRAAGLSARPAETWKSYGLCVPKT